MKGFAKLTRQYEKRGNESGVLLSCKHMDEHGQSVRPKANVVITGIVENSQAQQVGLEVNDIILKYRQIPINAFCELIAARNSPGDGPRELLVKRLGYP